MAIYQFGVNVTTDQIGDATLEIRDEAGVLIDTVFRSSLTTLNPSFPNGLGNGDSPDSDQLIGSTDDDLMVWDWRTIGSYIGGAPISRYFLPGGSQQFAIDIFSLRDGNDVLNLSYNSEDGGIAYGFSATAYGGLGNDLLISGNGNDRLFGEEGLDTIFGGAGDDLVDLGSVFAEAFAEHGFGGSGYDTIYGGLGNDTLDGGTEDDRIWGQAGLDTIGGAAGNDTIYGGDGEVGNVGDALEGAAGDDTIYGGGGADNIDGDAGFLDRMFGGDGNDGISDSDGFVLMAGGAGDDSLYSNFAANWVSAGNLATVYGGGGIDNFRMNSEQQNLNLVIQMDDGSADAADSVVLSNVNNSYTSVTATLGGANDIFFGSRGGNGARTDRVAGDAGDDTLYGGAGSDTLYGGAGFLDYLIGGTQTALASDGSDVLADSDGVVYARGGEGDDTLDIAFAANWIGAGGNASDLVTLDGNGGADSFILSSGNSALRLLINGDDGSADAGDSVDWSAIASSYDTITAVLGSGNDNYIGTGPGGTGNLIDIVYGGVGTDTLSGGIGNDTLYGSNAGNSMVDGGDTLFGRGGNDTLAGGFGIDTLDGGANDDVLIFNADNTVTGDNAAQDYVQAWDGSALLGQHSYAGRTVNWSFDTFEGSGGIDSLVGTAGNDVLLGNTDDLYVNGAAQSSSPGRMANIEVVLLGTGADIFVASDPAGATTTGTVYGTAMTIFAGEGADVAYAGSGNDLLVGDDSTGSTDILAGGQGNDTIWGDLQGQANSAVGAADTLYGSGGDDSIYGGAGGDSLFGGAGADTIDAGLGDDYVLDMNNVALIFGGDGSDLFVLSFTGSTQSLGASRTGNDALGDGNDQVYVGVGDPALSYDSVSIAMGAGDDRFISGNAVSGNGTDRISGESGNDLISSWSGNDTISGGAGEDVLWGGAGGDTIYGGADDDLLYPGGGPNDFVYGGPGADAYYWARGDGAGDQLFDEFRGTPGTTQQAYNGLLVYSGFDATGNYIPGAGVVERDHILTDNIGGDDMVQLVDIDGAAGTLWRLDVISGLGAGSSVTFDQRDIQVIALSNHEPNPGEGVIQYYQWDANAGAYVFLSG